LKVPACHIPTPRPSQPVVSPFSWWPRPVSILTKLQHLNQVLSSTDPMAAMWSFDHSTIYCSLHLRLAIANDLSLVVGHKDRSKLIVMQQGYQLNSCDLMHIQETQLRQKKNKTNSKMVVRCSGACLGPARGYRPRQVLAPRVPRVCALRDLSQRCKYES
jgi:hypothetical protein